MRKDFAPRVVTGSCNLSPFVGERMLADKFLRRSIVVRELMPQDLNLEMDQLGRDEAVSAARYLAAVVGKAQAKQLFYGVAPSRIRFAITFFNASKPRFAGSRISGRLLEWHLAFGR
jgi:uncharacterized protein (DUF2252 family)